MYADQVMPYVLLGLRNYMVRFLCSRVFCFLIVLLQEYEVCGIAVGGIGDICRALEKEFLRYSNDVISILLNNLKVL